MAEIRSDRSNSRRGHTSLRDIKQGVEKGKNRKVSSRGALPLITLLSTDRTIRQFTQAGSQLGDREMHVQTHAYVGTHTHAAEDISRMIHSD